MLIERDWSCVIGVWVVGEVGFELLSPVGEKEVV